MIERWLQITCDECGETDNSTAPNMTVAEFLEELRTCGSWVRRGSRHLCGACRGPQSPTTARVDRK